MSAQCLAQSLALGGAQWTNSVNKGHYYQQACCPAPFPFQLQKASQRAINAATCWLPSSHAGHICEGFENKSSVQGNNQIPIKPNYLHCLLIALLLRLSPSNKWGSDLRYGSGKGGPGVHFCRGYLLHNVSWHPRGVWMAARSQLPFVSPIITHKSLHYDSGPLYCTNK